MLNSLVNNLSIWQSEHGTKSMKNDPVKYKTVRQLLISEDTSPSSTHQPN